MFVWKFSRFPATYVYSYQFLQFLFFTFPTSPQMQKIKIIFFSFALLVATSLSHFILAGDQNAEKATPVAVHENEEQEDLLELVRNYQENLVAMLQTMCNHQESLSPDQVAQCMLVSKMDEHFGQILQLANSKDEDKSEKIEQLLDELEREVNGQFEKALMAARKLIRDSAGGSEWLKQVNELLEQMDANNRPRKVLAKRWKKALKKLKQVQKALSRVAKEEQLEREKAAKSGEQTKSAAKKRAKRAELKQRLQAQNARAVYALMTLIEKGEQLKRTGKLTSPTSAARRRRRHNSQGYTPNPYEGPCERLGRIMTRMFTAMCINPFTGLEYFLENLVRTAAYLLAEVAACGCWLVCMPFACCFCENRAKMVSKFKVPPVEACKFTCFGCLNRLPYPLNDERQHAACSCWPKMGKEVDDIWSRRPVFDPAHGKQNYRPPYGPEGHYPGKVQPGTGYGFYPQPAAPTGYGGQPPPQGYAAPGYTAQGFPPAAYTQVNNVYPPAAQPNMYRGVGSGQPATASGTQGKDAKSAKGAFPMPAPPPNATGKQR